MLRVLLGTLAVVAAFVLAFIALVAMFAWTHGYAVTVDCFKAVFTLGGIVAAAAIIVCAIGAILERGK